MGDYGLVNGEDCVFSPDYASRIFVISTRYESIVATQYWADYLARILPELVCSSRNLDCAVCIYLD